MFVYACVCPAFCLSGFSYFFNIFLVWNGLRKLNLRGGHARCNHLRPAGIFYIVPPTSECWMRSTSSTRRGCTSFNKNSGDKLNAGPPQLMASAAVPSFGLKPMAIALTSFCQSPNEVQQPMVWYCSMPRMMSSRIFGQASSSSSRNVHAAGTACPPRSR